MATNSYQNEIPPSRVNIRLNVEQEGAQKKMELPLKLLVLGDFFSQYSKKSSLEDREKFSLSGANIDQVMQAMHLQIEKNITIDKLAKSSGALEKKAGEEAEDMPVNLRFYAMDDFRPEAVLQQIPRLKRLLGARNLLRDFGAQFMEKRALRKSLEELVQKPEQIQRVHKHLLTHLHKDELDTMVEIKAYEKSAKDNSKKEGEE
jgi:type VI secretion system protein ImpB